MTPSPSRSPTASRKKKYKQPNKTPITFTNSKASNQQRSRLSEGTLLSLSPEASKQSPSETPFTHRHHQTSPYCKQASKQTSRQASKTEQAEPSTICTITLTIPTSRESTAEHPCQLPHRKYPGFRKPGVAHPVPLVARTLTCLITFRH